jgi:hypothetical protein
MSDQELYDIASQRISRRNRRWTLWAVDLAGLIMSVAGVVLLSDSEARRIAVSVMLAWAAIFVLHTFIVTMAHSRDEDIEKEVAKLRDATNEKPKRLRLTDDGEIMEYTGREYDEAKS